jgi:large-conductance mechanosensitive channel
MDSAIGELFNMEYDNMMKLVVQVLFIAFSIILVNNNVLQLESENAQLNDRKKVLDQRINEQLTAIKEEHSRLDSVSRQLS